MCSKLNDACLGKASSTLIMYYGCEYTEDFTAVKAFCTQVQDKGETQDIIDTLVPQFAVTIAKKWVLETDKLLQHFTCASC